jgi:hypothetical protein
MTAAQLVLAVLAASSCGCVLAGLSPIPDVRTPADRAHDLDARCRTDSEQAGEAYVSSQAIQSVEPYSTVVPSSSGHDARMLGARIHVRPLPGLTRELLALTLQCHQARVVLGAATAASDDPYVLPDDWLTIDVDSEGNGFVVDVYPVDFKNGREVLARARRYASTAGPATP